MTNDTFHTYTFDAEGNITAVDSGGAAQYVYNALNQRVQAVVGGTITEYVFSAAIIGRLPFWKQHTTVTKHIPDLHRMARLAQFLPTTVRLRRVRC